MLRRMDAKRKLGANGRPFLACAAFVVGLLLAPPMPAAAHTFSDSHQDFSVEVRGKAGEKVCVALPLGQDDPQACADVDLAPIRDYSQPGVTVVGFTYVLDEDRAFMVIVLREDGVVTPTMDELDDIAANLRRGYEQSLPRGSIYRADPDRIRQVNGLTMIDAGGAVKYPAGSVEGEVMDYMRSAYIPVERGGYAVMVAGLKGNDGRFDALFEETIATVKVNKPDLASSKLARAMKQLVWVAVPFAGLTMLLGVVAFFVVRANRKKMRDAQAAAFAARPFVPPPGYYPPPHQPGGYPGYGPPPPR